MGILKLLLYISLLLTYLTFSLGEVDEDVEYYDDDYYEDDYWCDSYTKHRCFEDNKGYTVYRCNDAKKRWDVARIVKCPDIGCECGMNSNSDWTCNCNPTKKPVFPDTGVLSWNGTYAFNNYSETGKPLISYIPGEVLMDSRGRYLSKKTTVSERGTKRTVEFEIIVPSSIEGFYVKHTGNTTSKICASTETKSAGNLRSIWRDFGHARTYYKLVKETPQQQKNNVYIQKWTQEFIDDYEFNDWEYTLEYDSKKGVAIPLRYNVKQGDVWYNRRISINLMYAYKPIEKDEESFRLEDYCNV